MMMTTADKDAVNQQNVFDIVLPGQQANKIKLFQSVFCSLVYLVLFYAMKTFYIIVCLINILVRIYLSTFFWNFPKKRTKSTESGK